MTTHSAALLLLLVAVPACVGDDPADASRTPPSRAIQPDTREAIPLPPEGMTPRHTLYAVTRWRGNTGREVGLWPTDIDYKQEPDMPPWRISVVRGRRVDATAWLDSTFNVVYLEEGWAEDAVRLRRIGDRLTGVRYPFTGNSPEDSVGVDLVPGAPLFTELSLMVQLVVWPLGPGWEHRGVMGRRGSPLQPERVHLRVVGEERVQTLAGMIDCWIVVVGADAGANFEPAWFWVGKRDRVVAMRRRFLPWPDDVEEVGPVEWGDTHESEILIDAVIEPPRRGEEHAADSAHHVILRELHSAGYDPRVYNNHVEIPWRMDITTYRYRPLTAVDSAAIAGIIARHTGGRAFRVEPPTDRTFVRLPRAPVQMH